MTPETAGFIFDRLIPGWRNGPLVTGNRRLRCPLHDDTLPSLDISEEGGVWICRAGCGAGGAVDFARRVVGDDGARQLLREVGDAFNEASQRQRKRRTAAKSVAVTKAKSPASVAVTSIGPPTEAQVTALGALRRITDAADLEQFVARLVHVWDEDWVGFPTLAGGWKLWAVDRQGRPRWDANRRLVRKNVGSASLVVSSAVHQAIDSGRQVEERLFDVEGESDALAATSAGIKYVLASTGGAVSLKAHRQHREMLEALAPAEVIIVRDLDVAGRKSAKHAATWWHEAGVSGKVRVLELPGALGEKGDLRDYLRGRPNVNDTPAFEPLGTGADLEQLASEAPEWSPPDRDSPDEGEQERRHDIGASSQLRWRTAREIAETTPPIVPWRAKPWLADGALTELDGKIKLSGKTTFTFAMIAAILDGADFLGEPTVKSPVVLLSEQPDTSLREALRRGGLLEREDLAILSYWDAGALAWPKIVAAAITKAAMDGQRPRAGGGYLGEFARFAGKIENNSGDGNRALRPLQEAVRQTWARGAAQSPRAKVRGGGGRRGQGLHGDRGGVDIILLIRRPAKAPRPTFRDLQAVSRLDERLITSSSTPPTAATWLPVPRRFKKPVQREGARRTPRTKRKSFSSSRGPLKELWQSRTSPKGARSQKRGCGLHFTALGDQKQILRLDRLKATDPHLYHRRADDDAGSSAGRRGVVRPSAL